MEYPETELQYWSAFFSINEGSQATNQAISLKQKQNSVTVEQSQNDLMRVLGNG